VLTGIADRVDGYVHDGKLYLRVVDYKTGRKSFDLSDVWYGLGMQMLLYLFALQRSGETRYHQEIVPAGVLYIPARDVLLSASSSLAPEEILKQKAKKRQRSGLLLADDAILQAMERGETPEYLPVTIRGGNYSGSALATAEQLGALSRHIDETLREMAKELRAGSVVADPWYRSQTESACNLCDYAGACHFDAEDDCIRYVSRLQPRQVWELIQGGKEERE
jgi:ATP-dependent helicase/nuclease subunit B